LVLGALLLALAVSVNMLVGGPSFFSRVVASRPYSFEQLRTMFFVFYSPLGMPLAVSTFWSIWQFRNRQARVICLYFFSSLLIGTAFAGGLGVNANTFFDNLFAISIIMAACLDSLWKAPIPSLGKGGRWRFLVPVLLYSTVVMEYVPRGATMPKFLSELPVRQKLFDQEVSFLAAQPGSAICESLIMCYYAGKPYTLNPLGVANNARVGKVSSRLVKQITGKMFGAIQLHNPVTPRGNSYFPNAVLDAIDQSYVEALKGPDCHIYIPRVEPRGP
jgi:hypothetical protein